jgi:hypothetical protein
MEALDHAASRQAEPGWPQKGSIDMNLKTTGIALGVMTTLVSGAAFAQPGPQSGPYDQGQGYYQQAPGQGSYHQHRHHHGVVALLKEEMNAGRLSKSEGALLIGKIKQLHAERRAEREARYGGEGAQQMQQPR